MTAMVSATGISTAGVSTRRAVTAAAITPWGRSALTLGRTIARRAPLGRAIGRRALSGLRVVTWRALALRWTVARRALPRRRIVAGAVAHNRRRDPYRCAIPLPASTVIGTGPILLTRPRGRLSR